MRKKLILSFLMISFGMFLLVSSVYAAVESPYGTTASYLTILGDDKNIGDALDDVYAIDYVSQTTQQVATHPHLDLKNLTVDDSGSDYVIAVVLNAAFNSTAILDTDDGYIRVDLNVNGSAGTIEGSKFEVVAYIGGSFIPKNLLAQASMFSGGGGSSTYVKQIRLEIGNNYKTGMIRFYNSSSSTTLQNMATVSGDKVTWTISQSRVNNSVDNVRSVTEWAGGVISSYPIKDNGTTVFVYADLLGHFGEDIPVAMVTSALVGGVAGAGSVVGGTLIADKAIVTEISAAVIPGPSGPQDVVKKFKEIYDEISEEGKKKIKDLRKKHKRLKGAIGIETLGSYRDLSSDLLLGIKMCREGNLVEGLDLIENVRQDSQSELFSDLAEEASVSYLEFSKGGGWI